MFNELVDAKKGICPEAIFLVGCDTPMYELQATQTHRDIFIGLYRLLTARSQEGRTRLKIRPQLFLWLFFTCKCIFRVGATCNCTGAFPGRRAQYWYWHVQLHLVKQQGPHLDPLAGKARQKNKLRKVYEFFSIKNVVSFCNYEKMQKNNNENPKSQSPRVSLPNFDKK